jgi:4-diphosphocytidyl-2-C-methyl-D-erythritol kinase
VAAARLGSDVPSQVQPGHALVTGTGEEVEPLDLPPATVLLVPAAEGLASRAVYARLDRDRGWRERLEPERLRGLANGPLPELAEAVENDLQAAVLALRPELERTLAALRDAGPLAAAISGSGPTAFGLFAGEEEAKRAAAAIPGSILTRFRSTEAG